MAIVNDINLDTSQIRSWRSIITLIVFVLTNLAVLFPFHVPVPIPRKLWRAGRRTLVRWRILPPRALAAAAANEQHDSMGRYVWCLLPINFLTAPLIADLFLLAILAIGRQEVHDGTIGANHISPIDVMVFFLSLAYIAISIDASGLIRFLAFKVLRWGGDAGHRLYLYLYTFFFALTCLVGNDPVILSGTPFLSYMTSAAENIDDPKAWIFAQFAVANIGSAVLVSSNPTNLVIAGAFTINFLKYTANIIVPTLATAVVLFPCLLFVLFRDERLIPRVIHMHEAPDTDGHQSVNPNIPRPAVTPQTNGEGVNDNSNEKQLLSELYNPYLDKAGAIVGTVIMATTLITVLALNAASSKTGEHPVFWVTLPAAALMFTWDMTTAWLGRHESRRIAAELRTQTASLDDTSTAKTGIISEGPPSEVGIDEKSTIAYDRGDDKTANNTKAVSPTKESTTDSRALDTEKQSLVSILEGSWRWARETFPKPTTVVSLLPFALVPFAFCMFVLVQGLVSRGWVPVFAHGWDHWVDKTGTVGAIGGMGFLAVILCNFAGTNIGTAILLSRVIQAWAALHASNDDNVDISGPQRPPISDRTFHATIYALVLGVNFGAFSLAFSASLAGLLWRDILARKSPGRGADEDVDGSDEGSADRGRPRRAGADVVGARRFAIVNTPIVAIAMVVGCVVLLGEVYIVRGTGPVSGVGT